MQADNSVGQFILAVAAACGSNTFDKERHCRCVVPRSYSGAARLTAVPADPVSKCTEHLLGATEQGHHSHCQ